MSISSTLDGLHFKVKQNRWLRYFAVFNRTALAAGFLPAGIVKIVGERFASGLSVKHPMGHYLEALHHTGYYYTFIGVLQVTAAILLLVPRTALLGALLYFPILLNICILSFAVRFDGSLFTSTLMVLANLYLLCWHYDKLKYILPLNHSTIFNDIPKPELLSNKFPTIFFAGVVASIIILVLVVTNTYKIMPRNSLSDCKEQFKGSNRAKAGSDFCDCIHNKGEPLNKRLDEYTRLQRILSEHRRSFAF